MATTKGAGTSHAGGAALLAMFALVLIVFIVKDRLAEAPPVDASSAFDAERALARLQRVLGDERPHPVDSDANDMVRARLLAEIEDLGFAPEVRDDFSCRTSLRWRGTGCARVRNVVFRIGPKGGNAVLVASHYDSVPAGPGASDDGAGVAASLEIAALLKDRSLTRPVIFLITDGEEAGLLGAASFVRKDPYAKDVAAVVNMEARGVSGQAVMFETGAPNGREVLGFAKAAKQPVSNSLATAIYKMMPNDTDMSEFLSLKPDALNFAYTGGVSYYHTPRDDIAHLDRRSLAHLGSSAYAGIEGLLAATPQAPDDNVAFVDVLGRMLIVLSNPVILGLFAVGLAAGLALYARSGGGGLLRAALVPPAAMIAAVALAFCAFFLIGRLRSGEAFWAAYPAASQATLYLSAIAGAALALIFLGAAANRGRLVASAWLWFFALGAIAFHFTPGSAGVTAPLGAVFAAAALVALAIPRAFPLVIALAAAAAFILWAPMLALAESGLGFGAAWMFAPIAAILVCLAAPAALSDAKRPGWRVTTIVGAALGVAAAITCVVPAHSPRAPLQSNIIHIDDASKAESHLVLGGRKTAPASIPIAAKFEMQTVRGFGEPVLAAAIEPHGGAAADIAVVANAPQADGRRLSVKVSASDADALSVWIPASAGVKSLAFGGEEVTASSKGDWSIRCSGRACARFDFDVVVDAAPADWEFVTIRFGAGPAGASIAAARTLADTPVQNGDIRRVLVVRSM